jgi:hypothetical protein
VQQKLELLQAQLERILQEQQKQQGQGVDSGEGGVLGQPPPSPRKPKPAPPSVEEGGSSSTFSLPPGWEVVDQGPGKRVYYMHTASKKTQWEHPMAAGGTPTRASGGAAAAATATSSRAAAATTLSSPQGLGAVKGAPGWTTVRNGDGRIYYFHEASKKTQWEHPAGGDALDSFAVGSPSARGGGVSGRGGMFLRSPS